MIAFMDFGRTHSVASVNVCGPIFLGFVALRMRSVSPAATSLAPAKLGPLLPSFIVIVAESCAVPSCSSAEAMKPTPSPVASTPTAAAAGTPRRIAL